MYVGRFGPGAAFLDTIQLEPNQFVLNSTLKKGLNPQQENAYPIQIETFRKFVFFEDNGTKVTYDCFQLFDPDATDDEIQLSIFEFNDHFLGRKFHHVILHLA